MIARGQAMKGDPEEKTKKRVRTGERKKGGTQRGRGGEVEGWFRAFAGSAGAGAINLAGISELMNVIKIQPPAS